MQSHDVGIVYLNPAQLKMKIVSMKKADGKQTNKICPWHKLWALHTLFHIHKLHFATQTSRTTNITFKLQVSGKQTILGLNVQPFRSSPTKTRLLGDDFLTRFFITPSTALLYSSLNLRKQNWKDLLQRNLQKSF